MAYKKTLYEYRFLLTHDRATTDAYYTDVENVDDDLEFVCLTQKDGKEYAVFRIITRSEGDYL